MIKNPLPLDSAVCCMGMVRKRPKIERWIPMNKFPGPDEAPDSFQAGDLAMTVDKDELTEVPFFFTSLESVPANIAPRLMGTVTHTREDYLVVPGSTHSVATIGLVSTSYYIKDEPVIPGVLMVMQLPPYPGIDTNPRGMVPTLRPLEVPRPPPFSMPLPFYVETTPAHLLLLQCCGGFPRHKRNKYPPFDLENGDLKMQDVDKIVMDRDYDEIILRNVLFYETLLLMIRTSTTDMRPYRRALARKVEDYMARRWVPYLAVLFDIGIERWNNGEREQEEEEEFDPMLPYKVRAKSFCSVTPGGPAEMYVYLFL